MLRRSSGDVCRDTGVQHPAWHSQHIEMPGCFIHNGLRKFPVIILADGLHYFSALPTRVQQINDEAVDHQFTQG
jgi:enterochelin esterase-like enzyme